LWACWTAWGSTPRARQRRSSPPQVVGRESAMSTRLRLDDLWHRSRMAAGRRRQASPASRVLPTRPSWRVCGSGGSSGSGVATVLSARSVLSSACDDDSAVPSDVASGWSAFAGRFGRSGFDAFGAASLAPGVLSEVEVLPDGDGSSARAIPLPNPTATQADSNNAANRNCNSLMRIVDTRRPPRPVGMQCIQIRVGVVPILAMLVVGSATGR
jgi:hypothetical protein